MKLDLEGLQKFKIRVDRENQWRNAILSFLQWGVMHREENQLGDFPDVRVRIIHPDFKSPSRWFNVSVATAMFAPSVTKALIDRVQNRINLVEAHNSLTELATSA